MVAFLDLRAPTPAVSWGADLQTGVAPLRPEQGPSRAPLDRERASARLTACVRFQPPRRRWPLLNLLGFRHSSALEAASCAGLARHH